MKIRFRPSLPRDISWFKDIILPVFVTMLGVYLGLLVNQWQENQKDQSLKRQILAQIHGEIEANIEHLEVSLKYHQMIHDSISAWRRSGLPEAEQIRRGQRIFSGIKPAFLSNAAYVSASMLGSSKILKFDLYHEINQAYTLQQRIDDLNRLFLEQLIRVFTEPSDREGTSVYRVINVYMGDMIPNEERLLDLYKKVNGAIEQAEPRLQDV